MRKLWLFAGHLVFWLGWPGLWLYLRWTSRTRIVLVCNGQVLVVKGWMSDGRWQLPGGGLHRGEDAVVGLLREVREETGIILSPDQVRLLAREPYRNRGLRFNCYYYAALLPEKPETRKQAGEIVAIQWSDRKDVSAGVFGHDVVRGLALLANN